MEPTVASESGRLVACVTTDTCGSLTSDERLGAATDKLGRPGFDQHPLAHAERIDREAQRRRGARLRQRVVRSLGSAEVDDRLESFLTQQPPQILVREIV